MAILYVPRRRERDIERFIAEAVPHKPVLLLDGARQVGKTTLVDAVLDRSAKDSVRIDLERDTLVRAAIDDCDICWNASTRSSPSRRSPNGGPLTGRRAAG